MFKKISGGLAISLAVLFSCSSAFALNEYYSIHRSVRALGMGGAFYGLSDDEHALFYNPAGLSLYNGGSQFKWQIQADGATRIPSVVSTFTNSGKQDIKSIINNINQYAGVPLYVDAAPMLAYYVRKHFAVGLLVADTKVDLALLGRDLASQIDLTAISDTGLFIGYGTEIVDNLHLGFNVKGMARAGGTKNFLLSDILAGGKLVNNISDLGGAGAGVDFDLGATYVLPDMLGVQESVSLVMNNILASKFEIGRSGGKPPGLPRLLTLAGRVRLPGYGLIHHVDAVLDLAEFQLGGETDDNRGARYGSVWKHVNLGVEIPIGWFFVRGGLHQGNFTAGVGVDARFVRLDLATYAEEDFLQPGQLTSRRVALSLAFGWGGAAPQAVPSQTAPSGPPHPEELVNPPPQAPAPTDTPAAPAPVAPAPEATPTSAPPAAGEATAPTTAPAAGPTSVPATAPSAAPAAPSSAPTTKPSARYQRPSRRAPASTRTITK